MVERWQFSQTVVVCGCVADRPVAVVPLWQLAQLPVMLLCENRAGSQALVEWQSEHCAVVGMCVAGLPVAATLLWHELQVPVTWL